MAALVPLRITPDLAYSAGRSAGVANFFLQDIREAEEEGREVILEDEPDRGMFVLYLWGLLDATGGAALQEQMAFLEALYDHGANTSFSAARLDGTKSYDWKGFLTKYDDRMPFNQELREWFEAHPYKKSGGTTKGRLHGNANFSDSQIISALRKTGANPGAAAELLFKA